MYPLLGATGKTTQDEKSSVSRLFSNFLSRFRAALVRRPSETIYHQSQKHSTWIFLTRRVSAFLSFVPRLRKKRKRRKREYNKPPLVRLLRHSGYLLHAIPHSVDSKEDFFFLSFCFPSTSALLHYVPFHLSHDRAPTSLFYSPPRTRRAFTRSYNCRKETSTGARNLHRTALLFFLYPRLYLRTNRGFSSKGVTRLHERWKKFPRSENLPVFYVSRRDSSGK